MPSLSDRALDARLLIVDDFSANIRPLARLLRNAGYRHVAIETDGPQAVAACRRDPPDLLLLDLHMPELDGFGVLDALADVREGEHHFPVIVLTRDVSAQTRRAALAAGADDFIAKPVDPVEALLRVGNCITTHQLKQSLRDEQAILEEGIRERTAELELARTEVLRRLALATEYRDDWTHEHAQRIGRTSHRIADRAGIDRGLAESIGRAAPLHDIGKLAIPDAILLKPGALDPDEFELMKTHTTIGADILSGSRSPLLRLGEEIALAHHERWDGAGYPSGRSGSDIALSGRVVAVADVFDALTHARPYKSAWSVADAVATIEEGRGAHFDPELVDAFMTLDHEALLSPVGGDLT